MPLPSILKKASSYILGDGGQDNRRSMYQDGEALFCKNNVCVHPPTLMRQHCDVVHHPGYMTLTCKLDKNTNVPTLHLSWIPNSTLRKHPTTLENSTPKKNVVASGAHDKIPEESNGGKYDNDNERVDVCLEVKEPINCSDCERVCSGGPSRDSRRDFESSVLPTADNEREAKADVEVVVENSEETVSNGESLVEKRDNGGIVTGGDRARATKLSRLRSDSMDSRIFENGSSIDRRLLDDGETRNSLRDDLSIKSRSMSLTSTCSLTVGASTDGNNCKYGTL